MTISRFQGAYAFLSNFWPAPVIYEGTIFRTVEHAYQAAKFPKEQRFAFQKGTAGRAKQLGRRSGRRPDWDTVKLEIMHGLVAQKFCEIPDLRARLLDTGDRELVEGNTWGDVFWGKDFVTGQGENHLGRILMEVRAHLRLSTETAQ